MTKRQDLYVNEGETFSHVHTHKDANGTAVDLTGYSAAMSVKRYPGESITPQAYLSTGADADGGTLTLGGANGQVTIAMTADETNDLLPGVDISALVPPHIRRRSATEQFVYDLILTDASGTVTRALEGRLYVRRAVTP